MTVVHARLAVVIVLLALVGAIASIAAAANGKSSRGLRRYALVVMAVTLAEGIAGVAVDAGGGAQPRDGSHVVVGLLTGAILPLAFWMGRSRSRRAVIEAVAWTLFLGLALRSAGSGGGLG